MRFDVHHHFGERKLEHLIQTLLIQGDKLMATQAELAAELRTVKASVEKIGTETRTLITRVETLTAAVEAGGNVSPEVRAAMDELKAQVEVVDALVPDAP